MGRSTFWCLAPFVSCALLAQTPVARDAALRPPKPLLPEVVLASCDDGPAFAEFGLGDCGMQPSACGELRWQKDQCLTAGGVRVECRAVGVKLTFPSGRELLIAPDGFVHLRSGESAGPFPTGLELLLGDGQSVRIVLVPSANERLRDVVVGDRERRLQPWRRGEPAAELAGMGLSSHASRKSAPPLPTNERRRASVPAVGRAPADGIQPTLSRERPSPFASGTPSGQRPAKPSSRATPQAVSVATTRTRSTRPSG